MILNEHVVVDGKIRKGLSRGNGIEVSGLLGLLQVYMYVQCIRKVIPLYLVKSIQKVKSMV